MSLINIDIKLLNKTLANQIWQYIKMIIQHGKIGLVQKCKVDLTFANQSIQHIKR